MRKPSPHSRLRLAGLLTVATMVAGVAVSALQRTAGARSTVKVASGANQVGALTSTARIVLVGLSEESLPSQDLNGSAGSAGASAGAETASPTPSPSAGVPDDWQQVPSGGEAAPSDQVSGPAAILLPERVTVPTAGAESGAGAAKPAGESTQNVGESGGSSAPSAADGGSPASASDVKASGGSAAGGASGPSEGAPPPALDVSMISAGPDLNGTSLDSEIKSAATPALAASLRLTEEARKELGDHAADRALRQLARAVSIDPGNSFAYFYLGRAYILRKNYAQALTFLRRAEIGFASRPEWLGETLSSEGVCNEELGHMPEAARSYQRALGAAPNNLTARAGSGRLGAVIAAPTAPTDLAAPPPVEPEAPAPPSDSMAVPAPSEAPPTRVVGSDAPTH
jgi:tetratricopeptide repeat protein